MCSDECWCLWNADGVNWIDFKYTVVTTVSAKGLPVALLSMSHGLCLLPLKCTC